MSKVYKGDIGTLLLVDCKVDVSAATVKKIKAQLPDGSQKEWDATVTASNFLNYNLVEADTAEAGVVKAQAYVEIAGGTWYGETFKFKVYDSYEI